MKEKVKTSLFAVKQFSMSAVCLHANLNPLSK